MKANELMIGDWVMIENYSKICAIAEDGVYFADNDGRGATSFDRIEPIPLTKEILEKNGFKPQKGINKFIYENEHCHIEIICTTTVYIKGDTFRITIIIENVHELQHALRLCGIDKEIVL